MQLVSVCLFALVCVIQVSLSSETSDQLALTIKRVASVVQSVKECYAIQIQAPHGPTEFHENWFLSHPQCAPELSSLYGNTRTFFNTCADPENLTALRNIIPDSVAGIPVGTSPPDPTLPPASHMGTILHNITAHKSKTETNTANLEAAIKIAGKEEDSLLALLASRPAGRSPDDDLSKLWRLCIDDQLVTFTAAFDAAFINCIKLIGSHDTYFRTLRFHYGLFAQALPVMQSLLLRLHQSFIDVNALVLNQQKEVLKLEAKLAIKLERAKTRLGSSIAACHADVSDSTDKKQFAYELYSTYRIWKQMPQQFAVYISNGILADMRICANAIDAMVSELRSMIENKTLKVTTLHSALDGIVTSNAVTCDASVVDQILPTVNVSLSANEASQRDKQRDQLSCEIEEIIPVPLSNETDDLIASNRDQIAKSLERFYEMQMAIMASDINSYRLQKYSDMRFLVAETRDQLKSRPHIQKNGSH